MRTEQRRVVSVGEYLVSGGDDQQLITYSLGSCIGLTLYDPTAGIGGLLHAQMPLSRTSPERSRERPAMFVDTGVAALLEDLLGMGASRRQLVACIAGAANLLDDDRLFDVGRRNHLVLRKMLWKNGILVAAEDVGGSCSRTMWLDTATGRTGLKRQGTVIDLHPGPTGAAAGSH
ncbi:MAG TPA: chemotaxis protein CheD [Thermoleophilia bacterium]|nr:chemotaxis protein CheD [Thermoleophilia bacterium]